MDWCVFDWVRPLPPPDRRRNSKPRGFAPVIEGFCLRFVECCVRAGVCCVGGVVVRVVILSLTLLRLEGGGGIDQ